MRDYCSLDFTLNDIRDSYAFDVTCQGSVPQAIEAFLESTSFEDAVRNAVSIGGDSDMIAAITGSIAEPFYGMPESLMIRAVGFLPGNVVEWRPCGGLRSATRQKQSPDRRKRREGLPAFSRCWRG